MVSNSEQCLLAKHNLKPMNMIWIYYVLRQRPNLRFARSSITANIASRAAQKFLEAGNKVKVGVRFRGRQMTHIEVGQEVMDKFIALLSDYANIEKPSAMEGRWMYAILAPKKK